MRARFNMAAKHIERRKRNRRDQGTPGSPVRGTLRSQDGAGNHATDTSPPSRASVLEIPCQFFGAARLATRAAIDARVSTSEQSTGSRRRKRRTGTFTDTSAAGSIKGAAEVFDASIAGG